PTWARSHPGSHSFSPRSAPARPATPRSSERPHDAPSRIHDTPSHRPSRARDAGRRGPSGGALMTRDVAALQAALAYEHSAVYGYGVLGARLRGGPQATARICWDGHKGRRDRLTEFLVARGAKPVAAEPAYRLPIQ